MTQQYIKFSSDVGEWWSIFHLRWVVKHNLRFRMDQLTHTLNLVMHLLKIVMVKDILVTILPLYQESAAGSYDGSSSNVNVDCGFSSGFRFVLIKRVDIGDWCVFDTTRGITGNDPVMKIGVDTRYW